MEDEDIIPEEFYCKECGSLIKDESYSDEGTGYNTVSETSCNC